MVGMDAQLKGIILNHTLKSYTITAIEIANVFKVTMRFYGSFMYTRSSKRRRDRLKREKFLAKFKRDPLLVPIPFLEPGQSPFLVALGGPVHLAITTAFTTQAEDLVDGIKRLHHRWNCLVQEAEDAEKRG